MPHESFFEGDRVGFRRSRFGSMAGYLMFQVEGVAKYGWGPFRVLEVIEDRNGSQLLVSIDDNGGDAILPKEWFIPWDAVVTRLAVPDDASHI